jgi:hypothetical protein
MSLPNIYQAGTYNLVLQQGSAFELTVQIKTQPTPGAALEPLDLAGLTAEAQIRSDFAAASVLVTPQITVVDAAAGIIKLSLTTAQCAALVATAARAGQRQVAFGVWDLELIEGAERVRAIQGTVELSREVTRA